MPKEKSNKNAPGAIGRRRRLTTQEQKDLTVENQFLKGLVARDPDYVEAWQALGDNYMLLGRIRVGLRVDQKLVELLPEDALAHFNLACSYALNRKFEESVRSLHRALDLDYPNLHWLARDPDLKTLRTQPVYASVRKRLRELRRSQPGKEEKRSEEK